MGTNCASIVADLFLFCFERDFMLSLSDNKQTDIIEAFNSTSRYLNDLLKTNYLYFENMVGKIYPLSITNGIDSSKIYDIRGDFNFEIVNFLFLDGDVNRSPYYGVFSC